jgi:hypothetical protein
VASPPHARDYVVGDGETLWQLAGSSLGDPRRWREILELNPQLGAGSRRLVAGSVIRLPESVRSQLITRVANGEAPTPAASSEAVDARFQGRTIFFKARGDSMPAAAHPSRPDSLPP